MPAPWPTLQNLRVVSGGIAIYPPGATLGPRVMHDYEFVWIMEGNPVVFFNDRRLEAPAGTILLSQPGMTDRYQWDERARTVHAYFHFSMACPRAPWPARSAWPRAHQLPADDILRPLFRYVLALRQQSASELLPATVELMLRSFVTGNFRQDISPRPDLPVAVENALAVIRELAHRDPAPTVTLADLARAAHVSPEHLCRLFRQHLDAGPLETLRRARLERAATLVQRSNLTFKEIATITGFANPFHFSAAFKSVYGVAPRAYRAGQPAAAPKKL
jgi:AraC-like DNA-binding protein